MPEQLIGQDVVRRCGTWDCCVWFGVFACIVSLGCLENKPQIQPGVGVVVGDSMAPHFLGRHLRHQCADCRFEYFSSADQLAEFPSSVGIKTVCPNCGTPGGSIAVEKRLGENVAIDSTQKLERFDVVAFRRVGETDAGIKRVVGLPGEKIVFRGGNAYVIDKTGGQSMLVKTLEQQRDLRMPVFDGAFRSGEKRWEEIELPNLLGEEKPGIKWRQFVPKRCYDHRPEQLWKASIEDNYGFNQTFGRKLNEISEVFLGFDVERNSGEVWIRLPVGGGYGRLKLGFEKGVSVAFFDDDSNRSKEAVFVKRFDRESDESEARHNVEVSNFDGQVLLAIDGKVRFRESFAIDRLPRRQSQQTGGTVAIGWTGQDAAGLQFTNLVRLWRDVYWFSRLSEAEQLKRQQTDETGYFLVGDNVPVSKDSRHWNPPIVSSKNILGTVKKLSRQ